MSSITSDNVEYQKFGQGLSYFSAPYNEKQRPIQLMVNNDENFPTLKIKRPKIMVVYCCSIISKGSKYLRIIVFVSITLSELSYDTLYFGAHEVFF